MEALDHLERALAAGRPFPLVLMDACMPEVDGFAAVEQIRQKPGLAGAAIMLTSAGQRQDKAHCRELDISAYLTKPVGQRELKQAVFQALGAGPPVPVRSGPSGASAAGTRSLRILLAEDNVVNQKVASGLLQKHGHQVEVVANGREALERLESGGFDLVLMDVQMPEMDGVEAVVEIRKRERSRGGHIPIIALTAHALKSDQTRCLAAGMDDYASKPIRADDLLGKIGELLEAGRQS